MNSQIERRELRQFGFLIGSILVLIGLWLTISQGVGILSVVIGLGASLIVLGWLHPPGAPVRISRLDGGWPCAGIDQHPYHPGLGILRVDHPYGLSHAREGQGFYASLVSTRSRELSRPTSGSTGVSFETTILGRQTMAEFFVELWDFMRERKKFWMLPILIIFLLLGSLIVLTQGSVVAPFVYTLF